VDILAKGSESSDAAQAHLRHKLSTAENELAKVRVERAKAEP